MNVNFKFGAMTLKQMENVTTGTKIKYRKKEWEVARDPELVTEPILKQKVYTIYIKRKDEHGNNCSTIVYANFYPKEHPILEENSSIKPNEDSILDLINKNNENKIKDGTSGDPILIEEKDKTGYILPLSEGEKSQKASFYTNSSEKKDEAETDEDKRFQLVG